MSKNQEDKTLKRTVTFKQIGGAGSPDRSPAATPAATSAASPATSTVASTAASPFSRTPISAAATRVGDVADRVDENMTDDDPSLTEEDLDAEVICSYRDRLVIRGGQIAVHSDDGEVRDFDLEGASPSEISDSRLSEAAQKEMQKEIKARQADEDGVVDTRIMCLQEECAEKKKEGGEPWILFVEEKLYGWSRGRWVKPALDEIEERKKEEQQYLVFFRERDQGIINDNGFISDEFRGGLRDVKTEELQKSSVELSKLFRIRANVVLAHKKLDIAAKQSAEELTTIRRGLMVSNSDLTEHKTRMKEEQKERADKIKESNNVASKNLEKTIQDYSSIRALLRERAATPSGAVSTSDVVVAIDEERGGRGGGGGGSS